MTARRRLTPAERAEVVALANTVGPTEAARRRAMKVSTVTALQAKWRKNPEAFAVDPDDDVEELAAEGAEPEGAVTLAELERLERLAFDEAERAISSGKDSVRATTSFGILKDKVLRARAAERARPTLGGGVSVEYLAALRDQLRQRRDRRSSPPTPAPSPPVAPVVLPEPVEVEAPDPVEPEREPEPEVDAEVDAEAEVVPIGRPRRRGWPGRSVQEEFLRAHAEEGVPVDPSDFKPPTGA